ncbi:MAG: hypothetical protein ABIK52_01210, partial [Bacteroidota bacterium]
VGMVTRAGHFFLLSPECTVTILRGDTLRFNWQGNARGTLSFEVINNRGEQIVSQEEISGACLSLLTNSWQEGLFYWKFFDEDNLVSVGKIILKR